MSDALPTKPQNSIADALESLHTLFHVLNEIPIGLYDLDQRPPWKKFFFRKACGWLSVKYTKNPKHPCKVISLFKNEKEVFSQKSKSLVLGSDGSLFFYTENMITKWSPVKGDPTDLLAAMQFAIQVYWISKKPPFKSQLPRLKTEA